eukprot:SAG31_NODE_992_length_10517_cov_6.577942_7_plen_60_part_00
MSFSKSVQLCFQLISIYTDIDIIRYILLVVNLVGTSIGILQKHESSGCDYSSSGCDYSS